MINISYYENNMDNSDIINNIQKSFNVKKTDLNLVPKKTILISLIINKVSVGTICIISNNNLIDYLQKKGMSESMINSNYLFRANTGVYIYNMSVNKNYRGKGIGHRLLEITLYVCKQMNFDYCYSHCENDISRHIFKEKGFNKENTFRNNKNDIITLMSFWLK